MTAEAPPSKTYTLLTSVHNDAGKTDASDDANNTDDYNRVIGIAHLKTFNMLTMNDTYITGENEITCEFLE